MSFKPQPYSLTFEFTGTNALAAAIGATRTVGAQVPPDSDFQVHGIFGRSSLDTDLNAQFDNFQIQIQSQNDKIYMNNPVWRSNLLGTARNNAVNAYQGVVIEAGETINMTLTNGVAQANSVQIVIQGFLVPKSR